jgi:outer membrane lipoprotein-sorting protein
MFIRLTALLFFGFISSAATAQNKPEHLNDAEALQGHFTQLRHLSGFERPIKSEGDFYFIPDHGLIWQTVSPFNTRLEINKDGTRQSIEGEETMTLSVAQFPALKTLHEVLEQSLRGNWSELETQFKSPLSQTTTGWTLLFHPKDQNLSLAFEELQLSGARFLNQLIIKKTLGDWDEIHFSDQKVLPRDIVLEALKK